MSAASPKSDDAALPADMIQFLDVDQPSGGQTSSHETSGQASPQVSSSPRAQSFSGASPDGSSTAPGSRRQSITGAGSSKTSGVITRRVDASGKNIFVNGLPDDVDDAALRTMFQTYGAVTSTHVLRHRDTGASKRMGFVQFAEVDSVAKAVTGMNGHRIGEFALHVRAAYDDQEYLPEETNKLFVRHVPEKVTEAQLWSYFERISAGTVREVTVKSDISSQGRLEGGNDNMAYVTFDTIEMANQALDTYVSDATPFGGSRPLLVKRAESLKCRNQRLKRLHSPGASPNGSAHNSQSGSHHGVPGKMQAVPIAGAHGVQAFHHSLSLSSSQQGTSPNGSGAGIVIGAHGQMAIPTSAGSPPGAAVAGHPGLVSLVQATAVNVQQQPGSRNSSASNSGVSIGGAGQQQFVLLQAPQQAAQPQPQPQQQQQVVYLVQGGAPQTAGVLLGPNGQPLAGASPAIGQPQTVTVGAAPGVQPMIPQVGRQQAAAPGVLHQQQQQQLVFAQQQQQGRDATITPLALAQQQQQQQLRAGQPQQQAPARGGLGGFGAANARHLSQFSSGSSKR